ncbi:hypothetical protein AVEN_35014-1 [Araneus ventricosus]|uniref:Uncharacterized protein n=1 Tax=Araneus ventricosus TaxID=182803 RepID=A0A4Y2MYF3_ARAVE|nr:hypothetical protein AVEN_35014-1 [Araneus ventricosus]
MVLSCARMMLRYILWRIGVLSPPLHSSKSHLLPARICGGKLERVHVLRRSSLICSSYLNAEGLWGKGGELSYLFHPRPSPLAIALSFFLWLPFK